MRKGGEKLTKFLNAKQQGRLDGFFSVKPKTSPTKKDKEEEKGKGKGKGTKRKVSLPVPQLLFSCAHQCSGGRKGQEGRQEQQEGEEIESS